MRKLTKDEVMKSERLLQQVIRIDKVTISEAIRQRSGYQLYCNDYRIYGNLLWDYLKRVLVVLERDWCHLISGKVRRVKKWLQVKVEEIPYDQRIEVTFESHDLHKDFEQMVETISGQKMRTTPKMYIFSGNLEFFLLFDYAQNLILFAVKDDYPFPSIEGYFRPYVVGEEEGDAQIDKRLRRKINHHL